MTATFFFQASQQKPAPKQEYVDFPALAKYLKAKCGRGLTYRTLQGWRTYPDFPCLQEGRYYFYDCEAVWAWYSRTFAAEAARSRRDRMMREARKRREQQR